MKTYLLLFAQRSMMGYMLLALTGCETMDLDNTVNSLLPPILTAQNQSTTSKPANQQYQLISIRFVKNTMKTL